MGSQITPLWFPTLFSVSQTLHLIWLKFGQNWLSNSWDIADIEFAVCMWWLHCGNMVCKGSTSTPDKPPLFITFVQNFCTHFLITTSFRNYCSKLLSTIIIYTSYFILYIHNSFRIFFTTFLCNFLKTFVHNKFFSKFCS